MSAAAGDLPHLRWRCRTQRSTMLRSAVHCTVLALAVALLPGFAFGQDDQETRGVERLGGKKDDTSLGYSSRHALIIGIDDYEDSPFAKVSLFGGYRPRTAALRLSFAGLPRLNSIGGACARFESTPPDALPYAQARGSGS